MVKKQQLIQTSLLVIIITLESFFFVDNIIPVLALHKEQQLLDNYDDLRFADVVKDGDEEIVDMPLQSMKASNIYDDADESLQDCIYLAAKVGNNLADKEAVHCIEDVNLFKNKYFTDSSVLITITSTTTTGTSVATGNNGTSTSNGISTADADDEENNLINDLVKTGKFTEDEAGELVTKVMLINDLVKTGKFTEDEAGELVTKVMLINDLVKTGKFTEDEAGELVTKVMNNGANEANVPGESNVPEANVTANVPEANVTETNASQDAIRGKITLDVSVGKDPITRGENQSVTIVASDSATGKILDRVLIKLQIKDPIGIIVKNYTATEGNLTRSFTIGDNAVGKFTILAAASQAGVENRKSSTFQVQ
jgi:polyhydroxyalkanoate synthesis regulator phasin